jgi:hypothetical protein
MGKKQNTFEKHRREADKKRKAEDKRKRRLNKKQNAVRDPASLGIAADAKTHLLH